MNSDFDAKLYEVADEFPSLSSGHKMVVLTVATLIASVGQRSLVLIDEPETHLHPPLLASFIRIISELLAHRNGVAILATHSPVVLQEIPKSCVTILSRAGNVGNATRPELETFAENVGTLTREVFGLEFQKSGYYSLLSAAAENKSYAEVMREFSDQVGGEGSAIVRAKTEGE